MADQNITCKGCNVEFVFSERDQAFYQERGFSAPQSCRDCRAKRKAEQGNRSGGGGNRPNRY